METATWPGKNFMKTYCACFQVENGFKDSLKKKKKRNPQKYNKQIKETTNLKTLVSFFFGRIHRENNREMQTRQKDGRG